MSTPDEIAREIALRCIPSMNSEYPLSAHSRAIVVNNARDEIAAAIRKIEAERDRLAKEVERLRAGHQDVISFCQNTDRMETWDAWRKAIAGGNKGSWPRDGYEATLDYLCDISLSALNGVPGPPIAGPRLSPSTPEGGGE